MISKEGLSQLPLDGELRDAKVFEFEDVGRRTNDESPALEQMDPGDGRSCSESSVLLPKTVVDIRQHVQDTVRSVVGPDCDVTCNRNKILTIPWPTRDNQPLSEFTTNHLFTMTFPTLFPYNNRDFRMNRPKTIESMTS